MLNMRKETFFRYLRLSTLLVVFGWNGCSTPPRSTENILTVSILPIKYIVEKIIGHDFQVMVLVPPGANPETYEPTPSQIIQLSESQLIFTTGLIDFECELTRRLSTDPDLAKKIVNLSQGINLIGEMHGEKEVYSSDNRTKKHKHKHKGGATHHHHHHGVDPHIWASPAELRTMSRTAYERIALLYPDSAKYELNFNLLINQIDSLDRTIRTKTEASPNSSFLIYHPALTYWARAYGYEQIALENDGKEPSAEYLKQIAIRARRDGITRIFYQAQFSRRVVETLAAEIGAESIEIDPLAVDVFENLIHITDLITVE